MKKNTIKKQKGLRKKNKKTKKKGGANNVGDWKLIIQNLQPEIRELANLTDYTTDQYILAQELSYTLINYEKLCEHNSNRNSNRKDKCDNISNFMNKCEGKKNCELIIILLRNPIIYTFLTLCTETKTISEIKDKIKENITEIDEIIKNKSSEYTKPIMLKTILRNLKLDKLIGAQTNIQDNITLEEAYYILIPFFNKWNTIDTDDTDIVPRNLIDKYFDYYLKQPSDNQSGGEPITLLIVLGCVIIGCIIIHKILNFNSKGRIDKTEFCYKEFIKYERRIKKDHPKHNYTELIKILQNIERIHGDIPIRTGEAKINNQRIQLHHSHYYDYERTREYAIYTVLELVYCKTLHFIYGSIYKKLTDENPMEFYEEYIKKAHFDDTLEIIKAKISRQKIPTKNEVSDQEDYILRILEHSPITQRDYLKLKEIKKYIKDKSIINMLELIKKIYEAHRSLSSIFSSDSPA